MGSSVLGAAVRRVEDPRFITGRGRYLDDLEVPDALWMAVVRSPLPHGRLAAVDPTAALEVPGVVGVYTAGDLKLAPIPSSAPDAPAAARPVLAVDRVRFVGEPVAVVVADRRTTAYDAAQLVWVDVDPLPSVADPREALAADAPILFPEHGTNLVAGPERVGNAAGDPLAGAVVSVSLEVHNQRLQAVPLETNGAVAIPHGPRIEWWVGSQHPFIHQAIGARCLGIDRDRIRVRIPDLGGGFGAKIPAYPEQILVAALALRLGRPVRWQETRSENLLGMCHGRDQHQRIELGADADGRLVGMRLDLVQNAGAYPHFGAVLPELTALMASGPYLIPVVEASWRSAVTNTTPIHAYRGAGRPEATAILERAMDALARRLHLDPAELRRRNLLRADQMPYTTPTGARYDSGDYVAALDRALARAGYAGLRAEQAERRARGDDWQLGVGLACYVEVTAVDAGEEWSGIDVLEDGTILVKVGTVSQGQGHETAFAQIVADRMKVPLEAITIVQGDTDLVARGGGTMGSRSLQLGGSAVLRTTEELVAKAKRIVAHLREAAVDDVVVFDDGRVGIAGVPDSGFTWAELARLARDPGNLPEGLDPGLAAAETIVQEGATYPFGTHVAVVEVRPETGELRYLRHVAVDDVGTIVNRRLVDGQVHGGIAQGAGQALIEWSRHDEEGFPLTSNLTSYLIPTASMLPSFEVDHTITPTPLDPLGVKGVGEAGTIGGTQAVHNAVLDAVAHLGVEDLDMPATPEAIWRAVRAADAT
ncbi:MAG TPA: xanthine dehydrogenase family protein molybdopterin-binding subunit [Actinobacteria bacterium]|nr:xanthine dehydrogenase family protein molybdopterin-binding subunit [Actinomycetota bacterium]